MSLRLKLQSTGVFAAGILAASLFVAPASAQYTGPSGNGSSKLTKVAEILENPRDDADVTVQGQLLRKVGDEEYVFSDGTGEIVVEIDDDDFPNQPVDETTTVQLIGEVDTSRRRPPEIDVEKVRILK